MLETDYSQLSLQSINVFLTFNFVLLSISFSASIQNVFRINFARCHVFQFFNE